MEPYDAQQMITGMCHVEPCHSTAAGTAPQPGVCGCPWSHTVREAPGTGKLLAASCGCAGPDKEWEQGRTLTRAGRPLTRCHDLLPSSNGHMWPVQSPQYPPVIPGYHPPRVPHGRAPQPATPRLAWRLSSWPQQQELTGPEAGNKRFAADVFFRAGQPRLLSKDWRRGEKQRGGRGEPLGWPPVQLSSSLGCSILLPWSPAGPTGVGLCLWRQQPQGWTADQGAMRMGPFLLQLHPSWFPMGRCWHGVPSAHPSLRVGSGTGGFSGDTQTHP